MSTQRVSVANTIVMLAADAPGQPVRQLAVAAFTLARAHAWEGVDNLAVARRLIFVRRLVRSGRLQGDTL